MFSRPFPGQNPPNHNSIAACFLRPFTLIALSSTHSLPTRDASNVGYWPYINSKSAVNALLMWPLNGLISRRGIASIDHCRICCIDCRYVLDCAAVWCYAASATCFDRVFYPYFLMRGDLKELDSHFSLHGISSAPAGLICIMLWGLSRDRILP